MKVVAERNWNWMLYEDNDNYILSVLCGGVGTYTREVILTSEEVGDYFDKGETVLEKLARSICNNTDNYDSRQLQSFHNNDEAKLAVKDWRLRNARKS